MDPSWLAILLFFTAIVLVVVDLFVPSGGVLVMLAGISAIACVLFGFRSSPAMGKTMLTLVLIAIPVLILSAIKIWPMTPIGKRVILRRPTPAAGAGQGSDSADLESLVGRIVKADFPLMPSGEVRIDGRRYPATAEAGMIEAGQNIEVAAVQHRVLIVRPTRKPIPVAVPTDAAVSESNPSSLEAEEDVDHILETPIEKMGLGEIDDADVSGKQFGDAMLARWAAVTRSSL